MIRHGKRSTLVEQIDREDDLIEDGKAEICGAVHPECKTLVCIRAKHEPEHFVRERRKAPVRGHPAWPLGELIETVPDRVTRPHAGFAPIGFGGITEAHLAYSPEQLHDRDDPRNILAGPPRKPGTFLTEWAWEDPPAKKHR